MTPIFALAALLLAGPTPSPAGERIARPDPPPDRKPAVAQRNGPITKASMSGDLVAVVEGPIDDVDDGGGATYGFLVRNEGAFPVAAVSVEVEHAEGLTAPAIAGPGWTCSVTGPRLAACDWAAPLDPGESTGIAAFGFTAAPPYLDGPDCGEERSPCVFFEARPAGGAPARYWSAVVVGGNHPPVAVDDLFYTRGTPGPIDAHIVDNDVDSEFSFLLAELGAPPAHGTVTLDASQRMIVYTPGPTYAGFDFFTYTVHDGFGGSDTGGVFIQELAGGIAFQDPLLDIGNVEIAHVAMTGGWLENSTGTALTGTITVGPVPAAEVATVLAGTGYDPALAAFDPDAFKPVDGQAYGTFDSSFFNFVTHYTRPLAPLGTVWLARFTYDLHPFSSPGATVQASVDVVARSATAAEVPIHVFPDVMSVPADAPTMLRPLANDDSVAGNPLSVTAIYSADPWFLDPDSAVGQFEFADPQGPNGTLPYLGILYTPPPGYTGTNAVWYAATEIVPGWHRFDFAKITLEVGTVPPPVAVASGSATICAGGSAPLTGSGGVSCAWTPATGLSDASSCTPTASPAATTTYSLTVTDQHGQQSTNTATVTITVEPPPFAIAVGSTTIPPGGSAQLGGTGGVSCAWTPAAGLDDPASCTPIATPTATITYSLVVTSAAGCASVNPAIAVITVLASAPPDLFALGSFAPFQANGGQSVDVTALVINLSPNPAPATLTRVYLSTNARLEPQDIPLQAAPLPALAPWGFALPTVRVTLPNAQPGSYYLITSVDDGHVAVESDEGNNTTAWRIRLR